MTTTLLGELTVGAIVPGAQAPILTMLGELQGRLAGMIAAQLKYSITPPTVDAKLQALARATASLQASLPGANISLTLMADAIALLTLQVEVLLELQSAFGVGGVLAWEFEGLAGNAGSELGAAVGARIPAGQPSHALLLMATAPEAWVALGKVLLV